MRIIIAGAGSIGKRHARNLQAIGCKNIVFLRRSTERVKEFPDIPVYNKLENAVFSKKDLLMVCNPAPFHLELAGPALDHLNHVFIEKPISHNWSGIETFLKKSEKNQSMVWIGYDLRFDTGLQYVKRCIDSKRYGAPLAIRIQVGQYLPDWRPEQDYTKSVTAQEQLGGGVLLELSHELDYARWLLGPVKRVAGMTGSVSLKMETENLALALLEFHSGALGSVHLDCLQRSMSRNCQVICSNGVIHWDGCAHSAWVVGSENKTLDRITWEKEDRDTRFCRELTHILRCMEGKEQPIVSAVEGAESLKLIMAIKEASKTQKFISLSKFKVKS